MNGLWSVARRSRGRHAASFRRSSGSRSSLRSVCNSWHAAPMKYSSTPALHRSNDRSLPGPSETLALLMAASIAAATSGAQYPELGALSP
ncbi:hypothetical protein FOA52_004055 [Chlamydomonas sp. UWO 241]|nr:hypothetical protein FOA52_004055 [Chlamydomonas sp. UWO 241]